MRQLPVFGGGAVRFLVLLGAAAKASSRGITPFGRLPSVHRWQPSTVALHSETAAGAGEITTVSGLLVVAGELRVRAGVLAQRLREAQAHVVAVRHLTGAISMSLAHADRDLTVADGAVRESGQPIAEARTRLSGMRGDLGVVTQGANAMELRVQNLTLPANATHLFHNVTEVADEARLWSPEGGPAAQAVARAEAADSSYRQALDGVLERTLSSQTGPFVEAQRRALRGLGAAADGERLDAGREGTPCCTKPC
mmetsp:Transcript_41338/g.88046  ORF Transcript_41338/g.88046 Transcript_41338/m.88046 type:complete len:254 (+) Transcript_41338:72-833(+)